ncbi:MAG: flagella accessory protein C, partial [Halobacteria archaeon]|nr:flagella accessory protein C [Halobacteria archaeon]
MGSLNSSDEQDEENDPLNEMEVDNMSESETDEIGMEGEFEMDTESSGGGGVEEERVTEIESRMEDLESDVEDISSSVSAVRRENESVGESVQEIEDNVRKLLSIYEMVTKGENPFDEGEQTVHKGGGNDEEGFGLFGGDGDEEIEPPETEQEQEQDEKMFESDTDITEEFETEGDEAKDDSMDEADDTEDIDLEDMLSQAQSLSSGSGPETGVFDTKEEDDEDEHETQIGEFKKEFEKRKKMLWKQMGDSEESSLPLDMSEEEDEGESYYLEEIQQDYVSDLLMLNWISYLLMRIDFIPLDAVLEHYVRIGWISPEVRDEMLKYEEMLSPTGGNVRVGKNGSKDDEFAGLPSIDELEDMSYRELQQVAKTLDVKANTTREEMEERVAEKLESAEAIDAEFEEIESEEL